MNYATTVGFMNMIGGGEVAITRPIPVKTVDGTGVSHVDFQSYCDTLCEREGIPKLVLLRAIQDTLRKSILYRMNRSPLFRSKLQGVCNQWSPHESPPEAVELFVDRVQMPFDVSKLDEESKRIQQLHHHISRMDQGMDQGVDRETLLSHKRDCEAHKRHLHHQLGILQENSDEYTSPHDKLLRILSLKPHTFYRHQGNAPDDPRYHRAAIRAQRIIPETIQTILDNGCAIPFYLEEENDRLQGVIQDNYQSVDDAHKRISWLLSSMPEEEAPSGLGELLRGLLQGYTPYQQTDDDEEEEDENLIVSLRDAVSKKTESETPSIEETETPKPPPTKKPDEEVYGDDGDEDEEEEEDEDEEEDDDDEEEEEEDDKMEGGMYYMTLGGGKTSFF